MYVIRQLIHTLDNQNIEKRILTPTHNSLKCLFQTNRCVKDAQMHERRRLQYILYTDTSCMCLILLAQGSLAVMKR